MSLSLLDNNNNTNDEIDHAQVTVDETSSSTERDVVNSTPKCTPDQVPVGETLTTNVDKKEELVTVANSSNVPDSESAGGVAPVVADNNPLEKSKETLPEKTCSSNEIIVICEDVEDVSDSSPTVVMIKNYVQDVASSTEPAPSDSSLDTDAQNDVTNSNGVNDSDQEKTGIQIIVMEKDLFDQSRSTSRSSLSPNGVDSLENVQSSAGSDTTVTNMVLSLENASNVEENSNVQETNKTSLHEENICAVVNNPNQIVVGVSIEAENMNSDCSGVNKMTNYASSNKMASARPTSPKGQIHDGGSVIVGNTSSPMTVNSGGKEQKTQVFETHDNVPRVYDCSNVFPKSVNLVTYIQKVFVQVPAFEGEVFRVQNSQMFL